ncbi:hypothetical protein BGZ94_004609, partial [Podila epigama]
MQFGLLAISLLNTYWLFTSTKAYTMTDRDVTERPSSHNVRLTELEPESKHWSEKFPGKLVYPLLAPFIGRAPPEVQKREVWELSVWNPSTLGLSLF